MPIDFSTHSINALTYAGELARSLDAELLLLHVVDQTYLAHTKALRVANPKLAKLLDEQWCRALAQMARLAARHQAVAPRLRTLVERGSPAPVIVQRAKRERCDLIVMGTHGRTGLAHVLIGSVAEKVVRAASCPVLTVRRAIRSRRRGGTHSQPRRSPSRGA